MTSAENSIVITGCGVVTAAGIGRDAFGKALGEGRTGIGEIVSFDSSEIGRHRAAEIPSFDEKPFLRSPKNYLDRNSALAFAACEMAARESGLTLPDPAKGYGLSVGTWSGNMASLVDFHSKMREKGPRLAPPFLFPHTYYNTSAGLLSIEYGLTGPHAQFCSGSGAGLEAVAYAAHCLRRGRAPAIFCGGAEAFNEWTLRAAIDRGWVSPIIGTTETYDPFGIGRDGAIIGEGSAFFALETLSGATQRGAKPLARIAGVGMGPSALISMSEALRSGDVLPEAVDAVFASAGGYPQDDNDEAAALREVFGTRRIPVAALKASVGETLGAGGAINLAGAIACLERGVMPGTPAGGGCEFEGLDLAPVPRPMRVRAVMVNAGSPASGSWISLLVAAVS